MKNFRVTLVDINDITFKVVGKADLPEIIAERYSSKPWVHKVVQVEQYVYRPNGFGAWEVVFSPEDFEDEETDWEYGNSDWSPSGLYTQGY